MISSSGWAPIVIELLRLFGGLAAALVGGSLVILGNWIADRRSRRAEEDLAVQRERTLLTGMFAVRNHIAERLNAFEDTGQLSELHSLRIAQSYVRRFVETTPDGTERLMIAVLGVGLKLDTLLSTLDQFPTTLTQTAMEAALPTIVDEANELLSALQQFDIMAHSSLDFVSDDDLQKWAAADDIHRASDIQ